MAADRRAQSARAAEPVVIRAQRKLHARVFYLLTPLLLAALALALVQRRRAAEHLTAQPAPPAMSTSTLEKVR
jgi:hypothetical protein